VGPSRLDRAILVFLYYLEESLKHGLSPREIELWKEFPAVRMMKNGEEKNGMQVKERSEGFEQRGKKKRSEDPS